LIRTLKNYHTTVKSRSGKTLGASNVHIYRRVVVQDNTTRTQKPKPLDVRLPVTMLAEVQFVISMPTYIEARHM